MLSFEYHNVYMAWINSLTFLNCDYCLKYQHIDNVVLQTHKSEQILTHQNDRVISECSPGIRHQEAGQGICTSTGAQRVLTHTQGAVLELRGAGEGWNICLVQHLTSARRYAEHSCILKTQERNVLRTLVPHNLLCETIPYEVEHYFLTVLIRCVSNSSPLHSGFKWQQVLISGMCD